MEVKRSWVLLKLVFEGEGVKAAVRGRESIGRSRLKVLAALVVLVNEISSRVKDETL
jgi:hypothetical protein